MSTLWSILYVIAMASIAAAFEGGYLLAGDGFFLAASILAVFTGHWVVASENTVQVPVASTRWLSVGASYTVCVVLAGLVAVQALTLA